MTLLKALDLVIREIYDIGLNLILRHQDVCINLFESLRVQYNKILFLSHSLNNWYKHKDEKIANRNGVVLSSMAMCDSLV